jgi:hypothetical protein
MADLTTDYTAHIKALKTANVTAKDVTTLLRKDEPTIVAATDERADKNTQYAEYFAEN